MPRRPLADPRQVIFVLVLLPFGRALPPEVSDVSGLRGRAPSDVLSGQRAKDEQRHWSGQVRACSRPPPCVSSPNVVRPREWLVSFLILALFALKLAEGALRIESWAPSKVPMFATHLPMV